MLDLLINWIVVEPKFQKRLRQANNFRRLYMKWIIIIIHFFLFGGHVRVGRGPDLTHLVRNTQNRTVDGKTENGQHQIEEKSIGKGFEVTRINEQAILWPDNCRSVCLSVCGSKSSIKGSWNCKGLICSYHQHQESLLCGEFLIHENMFLYDQSPTSDSLEFSYCITSK